MPPHIFEVSLKVNTKVYLDVLKSVVIPWCNQVADGSSSGSVSRLKAATLNRCELYNIIKLPELCCVFCFVFFFFFFFFNLK